ncbi:UGSC family (seleno)protein [Citricoccus nitrophenolicus]|uniref:UGSC family (Seleno)protein n=1 Tax=Citricoccus nitrophenolicus TaxID=863575 RepID=A0ABV0IIR0_9MICC|nr:UGSC family (seleno)protein [Citricoccus sp. I39-566]WMY79319.1 UGSC family (seleno)protein [Citricoccus sp. I39-566]
MTQMILDPTGRGPRPGTAGGEATALAVRPSSLSGARIGLLDNTKHNALLFLQAVGELLVAEHGAASVGIVETKENFSVPVGEEIISRYRAASDVVVTGVGDCGSCSAAAVADGITFERAGLPAAVVLTDAFDVTGRTMAGVQGAPDYAWITTQHPMAVLTEDEVRVRARTLLPQIVATLTGSGA